MKTFVIGDIHGAAHHVVEYTNVAGGPRNYWGYCLINIPFVHLSIIKNAKIKVMKVKFVVRSLKSGKKLSILKARKSDALKTALRLGFSEDKIRIESVVVG